MTLPLASGRASTAAIIDGDAVRADPKDGWTERGKALDKLAMSSSRPIGLTPKQFGAINAVVTLAAMSFLVWVVYFHEGNVGASGAASLPLINAILTVRAPC